MGNALFGFFLSKYSELSVKAEIWYNLGQKVGEKFTKLSKIVFSMECFTVAFLQFFTKKPQNLAIGWTTEYSPSNPSISGIFLKFPNFLRSLSLKSFGNSWGNSYIHFPFHLWWRQIVLKCEKVSKFFVQDCT